MDETTLTISVESADDAKRRMKAAFAGVADATPRYTFPTREALLRTLSPNRWGILEALTGTRPLGVRELARRVNRDVKGVHTDAHALAQAGVIDRTADGKFSFPYAAVKVQFEVRAAA